MRAALAQLGDPQDKLPPVIHVAGTNGKGSTIAFMAAMAWAGGLRVHAFTKPHLHRLNERFVITAQIDEVGVPSADAGVLSTRKEDRDNRITQPAPDHALLTYAERVAATGVNLTQFDAQVCVALLLFSEIPADLVLIEAGMGGRDDSTNIVPTPALAVITPIAMDHTDILGPTLEDIARHKAGIIKERGKVVSARQSAEVMTILEDAAEGVGATLLKQGEDWDAYESNGFLVVQTETMANDFPPPNLAGRHQYDNAGLAAAALMILGYRDAGYEDGVMLASNPGRLQRLTKGGLADQIVRIGGEVWVDGGHNAHAAAALAHALKVMSVKRQAPTVAIIGLRGRKDAAAFVGALAGAVDQIIAIPLNEAHVPPSHIVAQAQVLGVTAIEASSLADAMKNAAQFPAPRVLICGSFLLAAEALAAEGMSA